MLIGVVGDRNPANETHTMLDASLAHAGAEGEWDLDGCGALGR